MALVGSTDEAEVVAQEWLKKKYSKRFGHAKFSHVMLDGNTWTLKADVGFKGLLGPTKGKVLLKVDAQTMALVGYSETTDED
jgi:hypothetical protein